MIRTLLHLLVLLALLVTTVAWADGAVDGVAGQSQETEQSEAMLRQLAQGGNALAQYRLAKLYFIRAAQERNQELALEVVDLLETAAEQEHGDALAFLGYLYMSGTMVDKNRSRAVYLWKRASRQGVALAQYNLGVYYAAKRTRADDRTAMEFYKAAYLAGMLVAAQNIEYMQRQGRAGAMRERIVVTKPGEQGYQGDVVLVSREEK